MPNSSSSWGTDTANVPVLTSQQTEKLSRIPQSFATMADLVAAVGRQRLNAHWINNLKISVSTEPASVDRRFKRDATIANSHARTVVIAEKEYLLPNDTSTVHEFLGTPTTQGSNGDMGILGTTGQIYAKAAEQWAQVGLTNNAGIIVQPIRSSNYTVVQTDNGSVQPFSGTAQVTIPADLIGFSAQLLRHDVGTLTVVPGSGVTLYHAGSVVANLSVGLKGQWILVMPGAVANEYYLTRYTGV